VTGLFMFAALPLLTACGPTEDTIVNGLQSPNPAVREDMVKIARNASGDKVVQSLIDVLEDPAPDIRREAIDSLVKLDSVDAVPALVARLEDEDVLVRRAAVDALGALADSRATEPLVAHIEGLLQASVKDPTIQIPLNAIWALGNIGDNKALDVLSRLRDSTDPYISYNANWALRQLKV